VILETPFRVVGLVVLPRQFIHALSICSRVIRENAIEEIYRLARQLIELDHRLARELERLESRRTKNRGQGLLPQSLTNFPRELTIYGERVIRYPHTWRLNWWSSFMISLS